MNLFVTDHPLNAGQTAPSRRGRRWLLAGLCVYPIWLLLLGPFWALDGRGRLNFLPRTTRQSVYVAARPLCHSPSSFAAFDGYLNWWCPDPNSGETTR